MIPQPFPRQCHMSPDARPAPRLRTLAEVDAATERAEALLARYRLELAELEAEGETTVRARMTERQRFLLLVGELPRDEALQSKG